MSKKKDHPLSINRMFNDIEECAMYCRLFKDDPEFIEIRESFKETISKPIPPRV